MSLVRPIFQCGASCWDPYTEGQINASDRVQRKAAKCAYHTNDLVWETQEDSSHLRPLQSIHRRTGMESSRGQVTRILPEQG